MNSKAKKVLYYEIVAALYILLFTYTAISKFRDLEAFEGAMRHSPVIGIDAGWLSIAIPTAEILIVVLLLWPRLRFIGICLAILLLLQFTAYILYTMLRDSDLPCTCGGVIESMSWSEHLLFNVGFIAAGMAVIPGKINQFIMITRSRRTPV